MPTTDVSKGIEATPQGEKDGNNCEELYDMVAVSEIQYLETLANMGSEVSGVMG